MARPLRVHIPGALYHVMSRGNARQQIFLDDEDFAYFLDRLLATLARFGVICHAYCLMPNHFHLLLQPTRFPLSRMMQQLNSTYSLWFNRRHQRVGHVLQGRFKALLVDVDDYYRRVLRYIVLNPVRAELVVHPADWPWSSYRATAGLEMPPEWLALDGVWQAFDSDGLQARERYVTFLSEDSTATMDRPTGPIACGSAAFLERVEATLRQCELRDVIFAERFACRPSLDRLLARAGDVAALDAAIREAFERHGYTLREIGEFVGCSAATIWRRTRRAGH